MKKQSTLIFALILYYSAAVSQTPAITMTSSMPVGSTVYITIVAANPQIQVDFGDGIVLSKTIGTAPLLGDMLNWTWFVQTDNTISGKLGGSKTVKVYGTGISTFLCCATFGENRGMAYDSITSLDVSNCTTLKWLDCSVGQLTTLNVSKNTALNNLVCSNNKLSNLDVSPLTVVKYLDCSANKLTTLDVSKNTALGSLYCNANQLTALDVSKIDTALGWLECSSNRLTNLDVSKNTKLWRLNCSDNQLTNLNLDKNTVLLILNCSRNPITSLNLTNNYQINTIDCSEMKSTSFSLDVSHYSNLSHLYCNGNQLTSLDVSKNTKLVNFSCSDNKLTSLDLTSNEWLTYMDCSNNQLTSLDISHNTNLYELYCYFNQLTSLDVSKNLKLLYLFCSYNQFTFATLPTSVIVNMWAPQSPIFIDKVIATGTEVDLSSQLTANGYTTAYTWKTKSGNTLVPGTDYSLTNGKTVFFKSQPDSVYCVMTNAAFLNLSDEYVLKTTFAKVSINTGIDNADAPAVRIYTRNKTLYIVALYNGQASVYDINGRLAMAKEITTGTNTIALPKGGVYLVRLSGSNTPVVRKVFAGN